MAEHNQRFDTFQQWVNKAPSWLTRHEKYNEHTFRTICLDSLGRPCTIGRDFMRARDENTFPVHWRWPDQSFNIADFDLLESTKLTDGQ